MRSWVVLVAMIGILLVRLAAAETLTVWSVDPHVKVFRDAQPPEKPGGALMRAARNEYESAQIAVRSAKPLRGVRVELTALKHPDGRATIDATNLAWNFVGFIPIKKNTPRAEAVQLRVAPFEVPDPLLADRALDLRADSTQPVWITVRVPKDAAPGVYRGRVAVIAGDVKAELPVELTVDPFVLPEERHLWVTNWFTVDNIAKAHKLELWSEPFWSMLQRYADNMAAHRQNVLLTPWSLVQVTREPDGKLSLDFRRFDRYVELFQKAGAAEQIEISHVGHGKGGWGKPFVLSRVGATDRASGKRVSLEAEEGLAPLLAGLERHLDQRGWLAKSMIHVADEPILDNLDTWRQAAAFVKKAAPRLRRIEAIETVDCTGALEVWVMQLCHFDRWRQAYEARRADGEFWYYICCNPFGNLYPNRFLDYPLSRVRVLHWLNYSERLAGYLHWGLNYWGADPFGTPSDRLPPGDTHVLYPGPDGPLNSIRWEIQRESIEDFEYLHLLTSKTVALRQRLGTRAEWLHPDRQAMEFSRQVVPAIPDTQKDPAAIMAVRRQVADAIVALDQEPLLLVETEPPSGSVLCQGPIPIEVRGITDPGTTVQVNGRECPVRSDGTFGMRAGPARQGEVRIEAQRREKKKAVVKRFQVRDS